MIPDSLLLEIVRVPVMIVEIVHPDLTSLPNKRAVAYRNSNYYAHIRNFLLPVSPRFINVGQLSLFKMLRSTIGEVNYGKLL